METHSKQSGNNTVNGLISSSQARAKAKAGLYATPWMHVIKPSITIKELTAAQPLLVRWIDRKDTFYYLVPFNIKDQTIIVVIIDAMTGRFKEFSKLRQPGIYPKINAFQAEKLLMTYLQGHALNHSPSTPAPCLVWKPCEQSQSPYAPLWRIRIGSTFWFVDQNGKIHTRITEIQIKGGGPL